jgi:hypothetical protein
MKLPNSTKPTIGLTAQLQRRVRRLAVGIYDGVDMS